MARTVKLFGMWTQLSVDADTIVDIWLADHRCPLCDMPGHWRSGQEFDHMMRCSNGCDPAPVWVPETTYIRTCRPSPEPKEEPKEKPEVGLKVARDLELLEARAHTFDGKKVIEVRCPSGVSVLAEKDAARLVKNIQDAGW